MQRALFSHAHHASFGPWITWSSRIAVALANPNRACQSGIQRFCSCALDKTFSFVHYIFLFMYSLLAVICWSFRFSWFKTIHRHQQVPYFFDFNLIYSSASLSCTCMLRFKKYHCCVTSIILTQSIRIFYTLEWFYLPPWNNNNYSILLKLSKAKQWS